MRCRWIVLACVVGVSLGEAPGSDQPDITMLYNGTSQICVAGRNTNGYGLVFMSEKLEDNVYINQFEYKDENGATIDSSSNCNFEISNENKCTQNWYSTENGIDSEASGKHLLSLVTDERWNNFEIHRTDGKFARVPKYNKKYYITRENFFTGISVRSSRDAQILLCSTEYPKSSACYWIIIDAYKNFDVTGILKCVNGVPDKWAVEPDCKMLKDNITIPGKLLNETKWAHFLLSREDGNRIRLWLWDLNTGATPLLDYTDDNPLPLSVMFVRSYNAIADWKVHNYRYLNILYKRGVIRLGPTINFTNSSPICVSLYVTMCSQCKMEIRLERENGTIEMKSSVEGDSEGPFMTWRNVRILSGFSTSLVHNYYLSVILNTSGNDRNNTYWAIDDFRKCSNKEIRVASVNSNKTLLCQSLKYSGWVFNPDKEVQNDEPLICPDGIYIGLQCNISCYSVNQNNGCKGNKICLSTRGNNSKGACTCAAGYTWESNCTQLCTRNYYGYNCNNKCDHCKNTTCSRNIATCKDGCDDEYLLPYCQTFPNENVYLNITKITDTEVILSLKEIEKKSDGVKKYNLTYKLIRRIDCNYKLISHSDYIIVSPSENSIVTISGLQPYSTYYITVVTKTTLPEKNIGVQCNTKMSDVVSEDELPESIFISDVGAKSVVVSWVMNCLKQRGPLYFQIMFKCIQDEWCDQTPDTVLDNINSSNLVSTINNLTPFTHYSVYLRAKRSLNGDLTTFNRTTTVFSRAGNSPAIRNCIVYSKNNTSISLRWLDPFPPYGQLNDYKIKYCYKTHCTELEITIKELPSCNLWDELYNCYTLTELIPNYLYNISIMAKNYETALWSPELSVTALTAEDRPSTPLNFTWKWENYNLNLYWNHPDITNGKLRKFVITLQLTQTEFKNQNYIPPNTYEYLISEEMKTYTYQLQMMNKTKLFQYNSFYILTICGMNSQYGDNTTLYIYSPPELPELTGNITVDDQLTTNSIVTIIIPGVREKTKNLISFLYVLVSDTNSVPKLNCDEDNNNINHLESDILQYSRYEHAWIAWQKKIILDENSITVSLGTGKMSEPQELSEQIINEKLKPFTVYNITIVLITSNNYEASTKVYHLTVRTAPKSISELYFFFILLVIPIAVAIYFLYRFIKNRKIEASYITTVAYIRNSYLEIIDNNEISINEKNTEDATEEQLYETPCNIQNSSNNKLSDEHLYDIVKNPPTYMNFLAKDNSRIHTNLETK